MPRAVGGRGAAGAARGARRCCSPSAGWRRYKGFGDVAAALERLHARGRAAARAGPGWWSGAGPARAASRGAPAAATHVHLAGRVGRRAAARALRARRRVRARHALRGLEPGHAGGDGARPAGGGHARGRHPRQGRWTARRAGWWSRATCRRWPAAIGALARDPTRARAAGRGAAASACARASPGRCWSSGTIALYEELLRGARR